MNSKYEALEEISEVLETLNEIIEKHGLEKEVAYIFCCGVPGEVSEFGTEYMAGYSWNTNGKKEFDAILTILETAYESSDDGKWELLNNVSLN